MVATAADEVFEQGWTILPDVLDAAAVLDLRGRLERLADEQAPARRGRFQGGRTSRVANLLGRDPAFEAVVLQPDVLGVVEAVLGDGLLLSSTASVMVGPGEQAQPTHSDDQAIDLVRDVRRPTFCTTIWALDDFTEENGATRLLPGTHRFDRPCPWGHPPPEATTVEPVAAVMGAGSVLVYHGGLYHGAGANTTDAPRAAVGIGYCAGFIRQVENQLLAVPVDRLAAMSPRLQQLCGLEMYRGILGHVDMRDPRDVLLGGSRADGPSLRSPP